MLTPCAWLAQCQIIYPRQQLLTLRELEMIGFIENNVSRLSLLLSDISRFGWDWEPGLEPLSLQAGGGVCMHIPG